MKSLRMFTSITSDSRAAERKKRRNQQATRPTSVDGRGKGFSYGPAVPTFVPATLLAFLGHQVFDQLDDLIGNFCPPPHHRLRAQMVPSARGAQKKPGQRGEGAEATRATRPPCQ